MKTLRVLRIVDWDERFENNRTREMREMKWVPMPNRHDGNGYTWLMDHPNGMAHYCAWALICQIASRCKEWRVIFPQAGAIVSQAPAEKCLGGRGTLLQVTAEPHNSASLARATHGVQKVFDEAIPRLLVIKWLEYITIELPDNAQLAESVIFPQEPAKKCRVNRRRVTTRARARVPLPIPFNSGEDSQGGEGADEVPSLDQVKAAVMTTGIPDAFVQMVYETWTGRDGKDGAGVPVEIVHYVRSRWIREQVEWRNGTHRSHCNQQPEVNHI